MTNVIFCYGYSLQCKAFFLMNCPTPQPSLSPQSTHVFCSVLYYFYFLFIIMMVITHSSDINLKSNLGLLAVRFLHCSRIKKVKNQMIYDSISYGSF